MHIYHARYVLRNPLGFLHPYIFKYNSECSCEGSLQQVYIYKYMFGLGNVLNTRRFGLFGRQFAILVFMTGSDKMVSPVYRIANEKFMFENCYQCFIRPNKLTAEIDCHQKLFDTTLSGYQRIH